jgi:hypothetical protein
MTSRKEDAELRKRDSCVAPLSQHPTSMQPTCREWTSAGSELKTKSGDKKARSRMKESTKDDIAEGAMSPCRGETIEIVRRRRRR